MAVLNVHERRIEASCCEVGALLDTLASGNDQLWPGEVWPRMRLDRPLGPGATGGHGPIRYDVEAYEPGKMVRFRFRKPRGFCGTHMFRVLAETADTAVLRHELAMETTGLARFTWPVIFRPLHDALIEDAMAKASTVLGKPIARSWSPRVRLLRAVLRRVGRRRPDFVSP